MSRCRPMPYPAGPYGPGVVSPYGPGPYGPGVVSPYGPGRPIAPSRVAPAQRVVHPTQNIVTQNNIVQPVEHIFPVHVHRRNNFIRQHHCRTVVSQSQQNCCYDINCCGRRRPY